MNDPANIHQVYLCALVALLAVGIACAVLSVFVVLLKWSFIGEGISHAGFAGAGTAALMSLAFPGLRSLAAGFGISVLFCLATALAIGYVARRRAVSGDAAIGVFVVASLAWGSLSGSISPGVSGGLQNLLFGSAAESTPTLALAAVSIGVAVVMVVALFGREIVMYCFDPTLAKVSGVPVGMIHYLLIFLIALVIIAGMKLLGYLLAPAMVILPGALALAVTVRLRAVFAVAITSALAAVLIGLAISIHWPFIEAGAAVVLVLFLEFLLALAIRRRS
jgi:ABC-type Mn2+/Zn2+ transport system permease subunit